MHHTDLPKWVASDAVALFAKEMRISPSELDRAEWTETDDYIAPDDKSADWEKITREIYWVTFDLKAYLFWVAISPDQRDMYYWEQICQGCGSYRDLFSEMEVETDDGRTVQLALCQKICAPDFWDDTAPGEYTVLQNVYPDDKTVEVRLKYWKCEHCDSVYEHGAMHLMLDTEYDPPSKSLVCSSCIRKEPDRWIEKNG